MRWMTRNTIGRSARRNERGAAVLEFGLVAPLLFMVIFGLVQYGYQFWSLTTASATAREAARRLIVGQDWDTCVLPTLQGHAQHPAVGTDPVQASYRYTDDAGQTLSGPPQVGDLVVVTVRFQSLHMGLPFLPVPDDGRISQSATARVENTPAVPPLCAGPGNP
jgi:hypothetical protein